MTSPLGLVQRAGLTGAGAGLTTGFVGLAGLAGFLVGRQTMVAVLLVVLPLAVWLTAKFRPVLYALAVALPYTANVSGGLAAFNLAVSDLLIAVLMAGLLVRWAVDRSAPELRPLRPMRLPLLVYSVLLLGLLAVHLSSVSVVNTGQRLELYLFPVIIGVLAVRHGDHVRMLATYAVSATLFGLLWVTLGEHLPLGQKNAVGGFVANVVLLLVGVPSLRRRLWPLVLVALPCLFLTQSRGAIVSVGAGLVAYLLMQRGGGRVKGLLAAVPLALLTVVVFQFLPEDVQQRNTSFEVTTETRAGYALHIREQYQADAWRIIHANPVTGIGVGQYIAGDPFGGTQTADPHQVLLLQAAEGGYPLLVGYVVLTLGSAVVLLRTARGTSLGGAALALQVAAVTHGMFDVYWVRGTPVLGWLVIGMALAQAYQRGRPGGEGEARDAAPTRVLAGAR
jgi:O-Antigen ligase